MREGRERERREKEVGGEVRKYSYVPACVMYVLNTFSAYSIDV